MNKIICFFLVCFAVFGVCADEVEKFSISVNGVKHITLPFALERYRVSPKDKVVVEEVSKTQIRVVGKKIGEANLTVSGAGITKDYIITVKSNIGNILKRLRSDLDSLPELDLSINDNYIVSCGVIFANVNLPFNRLFSLSFTRKSCINYSCFHIMSPFLFLHYFYVGLKLFLIDFYKKHLLLVLEFLQSSVFQS